MNDARPWGASTTSSASSQASSNSWTWLPFRLSPLKPAKGAGALDLHLAALEYSLASPITINGPDDMQSRRHWSELVEPYEHQIRNLMTFCRRAPVALIADDVGLGKTITAGLILSELMTRGKVQRALILCPKILMPQWREELQAKFQINSVEAVGVALSESVRSAAPIIITTYDSARPRLDQLGNNRFDMIIMDEAHKLRNLFGHQKPPKLASGILNALQNRSFRFVLMLTATPVQNRLWDLYSLIHCLAAAKGHRNPLGTPEEFARRFIADEKARKVYEARKHELQSILGDYMVRLRRVDSKLSFPERIVTTLPAAPVPGEADYFRLVGRLVRGRHALQKVSIAQSAFSSVQALLKQISNMHRSGNATHEEVAAVQAAATTIGENGKLRRLRRLIEEARVKRPRDWRVIVFTTRLETLDLIRSSLERDGIRVGTIAGNQALANQRAVEALRSDPPEINVIVSTDAGAEGVNLQVANVLVNYDLPWNPMVVEQRIGRIQRLASTHRHVIVVNLVTQGTVEETIVARLVEKLQLISSTIGDIESVLEASDFGDEDGFESCIKDLVLKALENQDVAAGLRAAQTSIERAKGIYESERAEVDRTVGSLETMHIDGPSFPKLTPVVPRLPVKEFTLNALSTDGAEIRQIGDGRHYIMRPGRAPETITFSREDAQATTTSVFGGGSTVVYERDAPAFDRLIGEWASREQQLVLREVEATGAVSRLVSNWFQANVPRATVIETRESSRGGAFCGRLTLRVSASVAHDRYEKLAVFQVSSAGEFPSASTVPDVRLEPVRVFHAPDHVPDIQEHVRETVKRDADIRAFCNFYTHRLIEELTKTGADESRGRRVRDHFTPAVTAELVAAQGALRETVECEAVFEIDGQGVYRAPIEVEPATAKVVRSPLLGTCEVSGGVVPATALTECAVTKRRVVTHLLQESAASGRRALPECFEPCERTGQFLMPDELERSAVSGLRVDRRLLHRSAFTGRLGLSDEGQVCEITSRFLLSDEIVTSEFSGRKFFKGEAATSSVSGVSGHMSEFAKCAESGAWILPAEGARSDVSGKVVRHDLLMQSERPPFRRGAPSETVVCAWTGRRLLADEVQECAVTGLSFDAKLIRDGEFVELRRLLEEPTTGLVADEALRHRLKGTLGTGFGRIRRAWALESPSGLAVVRVETSVMLGFGRKDLGMVAKIRGRPVILGRVAVGKTENGRWHPKGLEGSPETKAKARRKGNFYERS